MDLVVRPVQTIDASSIHRISIQDTVYPNMFCLPSLRVEQMTALLNNLGPNEHEFVAELDGTVVGYVGLNQEHGRKNHIGYLFIGVDGKHHGKGIGTALLNKILDLADHWLLLERVELEVLATNPRAQSLYERFGFVVEGRKKGAMIHAGKYVDVVFLARLRPNGILSKV
ncbi:GNAT family N-acetyltransferase [Fodinisporobacter ferrooxydans]|uniref:GNAT family N-acetyltransferase n=1 Tax=Fodinisporobacter ferrooxydans TaxID=2901836 RepID=A0ABY4CH03_9BACL|nr:GNAT family N-acetyltransferase [Alicyclobacillaceae bacterium MYW30-H2]